MATYATLDSNPNPYGGCIAGSETGHPHCGGERYYVFPAGAPYSGLMPHIVLCGNCYDAMAKDAPVLAALHGGQRVPDAPTVDTAVPRHENPEVDITDLAPTPRRRRRRPPVDEEITL